MNKTEKIIYWIGIYAICVYTHETFDEARNMIYEYLSKLRERDPKVKSFHIGSGKVGKNVIKIGF